MTLRIDTTIPLVVLPFAAIFLTNLEVHWVFFVSANGHYFDIIDRTRQALMWMMRLLKRKTSNCSLRTEPIETYW
jgi:hypothetical protein